jgi:hypothetical protein
MKSIILTLGFFISFSASLFSQGRGESLILKNGSIIKGKLIEATSETYRIRTFDGSILVFSPDEVESYNLNSSENRESTTGNFGIGMEAGLLLGIQSSQYVAPFGFNILGSYKANETHSLSAGTGIELLGVTYTPLFIEYKANLYHRATTPFIFARAGVVVYTGGQDNEVNYDSYYYYSYDRDYFGGPTATLGTGVNWQHDSYDMILSFGYRYIKTGYNSTEYNSYESTYYTTWNRLEVKLGFRF